MMYQRPFIQTLIALDKLQSLKKKFWTLSADLFNGERALRTFYSLIVDVNYKYKFQRLFYTYVYIYVYIWVIAKPIHY